MAGYFKTWQPWIKSVILARSTVFLVVPMGKVFLSYSRADSLDFARELHRRLERDGVECFFDEASIGRVLVKEDQRKYGYGHEIFEASVKEIKSRFQTQTIKISAQKYLTKFYESHNFKQIGVGYLEDGIPHIGMINH